MRDECDEMHQRDLIVCRFTGKSGRYTQAYVRRAACEKRASYSSAQLLRFVMIIAERILTAQMPDGAKQVPISIYAPRFADGMHICEYIIEWPGRERRSFSAGVDLVQALHSALMKIGI
ncbi:DUF6968 family protein [Methylobacterium aerolatum]|uniref:DUF6968 family protein n=1 Tax=Methylobacterium aerolatum TaxID=418708 RepID=UPI00352028CF